jgi:outer membrane receptor for ferrienterochelin and colicin
MKHNSSFSVLVMLLFLCTIAAHAQEAFTISGTITDKSTGETLIGVTVRVAELPKKGAITNKYGQYSLTLPQGKYTLIFRSVAHQKSEKQINLQAPLSLNIKLEQASARSGEVVVSARRENDNITSAQTSVEKITVQDIQNVPVLLGERDVIKVIQLLPGVKAAGEGSAGFSVRGGNTDQNLILLDEAPVYNAAHLLGFFSTFNSEAIKDVTLYKGGMPSNYGGRVSSVLDIQMNEGNTKKFGVNGGIGLISSKLLIEGPIDGDNSSFLIAGRRSYADLFLKLSSDQTTRESSLYFYDLNAKVNYKLGESDRLYLSGYFGRDVLGLSGLFGLDWGNQTGTLRWNHIVSDKVFSNTSLIYSTYNYNVNVNLGGSGFDVFSQIQDWNFKQETEYFASPENSFLFGVNAIHHTNTPGRITATGTPLFNNSELDKQYSWEFAGYATHRWKPAEGLNIEYGMRLSAFSVMGGSNQYRLNQQREIIDTISTKSGEFLKTYVYIEPRISLSWVVDDATSIKASYARNTQALHLLSNSSGNNPTDRWLSSNLNIAPQLSDQIAAGYFRNFVIDGEDYELGFETYLKYLYNQIDYKDGAQIRGNSVPETEILIGEGRTYGAELIVRKKSGRLTGWLSYTLSRSERVIDGINQNKWYPFRYDRTHDLSLVAMYALNDTWSFSANFVFYTGNAISFPSGKYSVAGNTVMYYTERNGYRMPDYHRLDLGATWKVSENSEIAFSLYNAYGRENAFTIEFRDSETKPNTTEVVQRSLFRWVPSISWNFKW